MSSSRRDDPPGEGTDQRSTETPVAVDHLSGLRAELGRFHLAVRDLAAPVPSCPGWRVGDLVSHLGTIYRMFRRVAAEGWMERPSTLEVDDRPAPGDERVRAWTRRQGELLVEALADLDVSAPRWNFTDGPQVGGFIHRRMHHETAVHRWDAERVYRAPSPMSPAAAADGTREYLEVFVPRAGTWEHPSATVQVEMPHASPVQLRLPRGAVPYVVVSSSGRADAVLSGEPQQLMLALWGREPLVSVLVRGDRRLTALLRALVGG